MMKKLIMIPILGLCLFAASSSQAQDRNQDPVSPNDPVELRACQPTLATVTGRGNTMTYAYSYDAKEFKKLYKEAVTQALAAGQPIPTENQVRQAVEDFSNAKLQKALPSGAPSAYVITISCHFRPRFGCTITIEF